MARKPTKRAGSKDGRRAEGVRLLLAGQSVPVVAKGVGVHVSTVKRWKALDEYLDALAAKEAAIRKATENDTVSASAAAGHLVTVIGRRAKSLAESLDPTPDEAEEAGNLLRALAAGKLELTGRDGGPLVSIDYQTVMRRLADREGG